MPPDDHRDRCDDVTGTCEETNDAPSYIGDQLVYASPMLSFGTHTVTLRMTGTKTPPRRLHPDPRPRRCARHLVRRRHRRGQRRRQRQRDLQRGLSVKGSGGDVYAAADEFHFVYQNVSGDATITARVASLTSTPTPGPRPW